MYQLNDVDSTEPQSTDRGMTVRRASARWLVVQLEKCHVCVVVEVALHSVGHVDVVDSGREWG